MEISLGRKGDYAVRAMLVLARSYGAGRRKSRQIAATMDIPERYLPQIMAPLVHAGLVNATAGRDGGYELARPPRELSLLEVVEVGASGSSDVLVVAPGTVVVVSGAADESPPRPNSWKMATETATRSSPRISPVSRGDPGG